MNNKLVKNTIFYSLGNILSKAITFILLPLYTAYLTPNDYGIVNSMQVVSAILAIFFSFGLERSIYRLYYDYKTENEKRNFFGTIIISLLVISTIILSLLFLGSNFVERIFKSIEFYPFYAYAIIIAYFSLFEIVPKITLQVKEKAKHYFFISIIQLIVNTLCVIWFVVFQKQGAVGMLKGALYGHLITLPMFLLISIKSMNFSFKYKILKTSLLYSLPMMPSLLSAWVINLSDRVFIERYFSTYEVGIYSLGYKIGQLVQLFAGAILMAYNPHFYKLANSENQVAAKKSLYKTTNINILILLSIGFVVALFSKDIILLFLNEKYAEAYKFTPIIILGYFFLQLSSMQNLSFYQEKKILHIMYIIIFTAIFNIIFNFILIPILGIYGAAYSTLITQIINFFIMYIFAQKYYFIPYNWKIILPIALLFISIVIFSLYFTPSTFLFFGIKILIITISVFFIFHFFKKLSIYQLFKK